MVTDEPVGNVKCEEARDDKMPVNASAMRMMLADDSQVQSVTCPMENATRCWAVYVIGSRGAYAS